MVKALQTIALIAVFIQAVYAQQGSSLSPGDKFTYLNIPARPENAPGASDLAAQLEELSTEERESMAVREILSGNVPAFCRRLIPVKLNQKINGEDYELVFFASCDYMAIGSDEDYLYIPLTPTAAQFLADQLNCCLPTKGMVDQIYANSAIRLRPQPIPPSDTMTTIPVFVQHTDSIKEQFSLPGYERLSDGMVAGHKKDIIISNKIYSPDRNFDRVVIYGWHLSENNPIQPVYNGHIAWYADYSHGVRLISEQAFINADSIHLTDILADPDLSGMLSDEGVINLPRYPESDFLVD